MAIHDRVYTRAKNYSKAMRKYHIDRDVSAGRWPLYYNNIHQYADNKIPMYSEKTNNKNRNRGRVWEPSKNWSITDKRKLEDMKSQVEELNN